MSQVELKQSEKKNSWSPVYTAYLLFTGLMSASLAVRGDQHSAVGAVLVLTGIFVVYRSSRFSSWFLGVVLFAQGLGLLTGFVIITGL